MIGHKAQDAMVSEWMNQAMESGKHICAVDDCRDECTTKVTGYDMCEVHTIRCLLQELGEAQTEHWLNIYMDDLMKLDWIAEVTA